MTIMPLANSDMGARANSADVDTDAHIGASRCAPVSATRLSKVAHASAANFPKAALSGKLGSGTERRKSKAAPKICLGAAPVAQSRLVGKQAVIGLDDFAGLAVDQQRIVPGTNPGEAVWW